MRGVHPQWDTRITRLAVKPPHPLFVLSDLRLRRDNESPKERGEFAVGRLELVSDLVDLVAVALRLLRRAPPRVDGALPVEDLDGVVQSQVDDVAVGLVLVADDAHEVVEDGDGAVLGFFALCPRTQSPLVVADVLGQDRDVAAEGLHPPVHLGLVLVEVDWFVVVDVADVDEWRLRSRPNERGAGCTALGCAGCAGRGCAGCTGRGCACL